MKICWNNIENLKLTKNGYFRDVVKRTIYRYVNKCKTCKEPFLTRTNTKGLYCCNKCKRLTKEAKKRLSELHKGKKLSKEHKEKIGRTNKGRKNSKETIKNMSYIKTGNKNPMYGKLNEKSANWKGGYTQNNIPLYDTYTTQLEWTEEVRRNKLDSNILEVKCFKCDDWFVPTYHSVSNRLQYLKGNVKYSPNSFYCSEQCKNSCSIFNKSVETLIKEDAIRAGRLPWLELRREIQPELRQLVLKRDNHTCQKCGNMKELQCHHVLPVVIEPLLSADIDNCITLCKKCHIKVHKKDGCNYNQIINKGC